MTRTVLEAIALEEYAMALQYDMLAQPTTPAREYVVCNCSCTCHTWRNVMQGALSWACQEQSD